MKIWTNIILTTILFTAFVSCKKKYDKDFIGPQVNEELKFELLDSLKTSNNNSLIFNFDTTSSLIPVFFKAKFDKSITWKLTITGDISGATKTFIGTSSQIDSLTAWWKGEQDSLYYFTQETCKVTLSDYYPIDKNNVYNSLSQSSVIKDPTLRLTTSLTINISKPKILPANAVAIFDIKDVNGNKGQYGVFYDSEQCKPELENIEASPDVYFNKESRSNVTCLSNDYLPYSKNGGPINRWITDEARNSPYYFILKGTDNFNYDYYIGRIEFFKEGSLYGYILDQNKGIKPENLWFNVFVYGTGDGSKLNYTVKEDDNNGGFMTGREKPCGYTKAYTDSVSKIAVGTMDDAFEYAITLDFKGWKLISVPYSKFTQVPLDGFNSNGKGERNTDKIYAVQFSLVAPGKGKSGQAIFDYPVMTFGGPLKY